MSNVDFQKLTQPFPLEVVKEYTTESGKVFKYIPTHAVIERLNEVTTQSWSFEIVKRQLVENEVIVHGRLTVTGRFSNDEPASSRSGEEEDSKTRSFASDYYYYSESRDQFGSCSFQEDMSKGDTFKAAASDALKKCATEFGVGLELYKNGSHDAPGVKAKATYPRPAPAPASADVPPSEKQRGFLTTMLQRGMIKDAADATLARSSALTKAEATALISKYAPPKKNPS